MSIKNDLVKMRESIKNIIFEEECNICCTKAKCYKCIKCDYIVCINCFKKYILTIPIASCANCDHKLNRELLVSIFNITFVNKTYKEHRECILLESEKVLLPDTMKYIKLKNNIKEYMLYENEMNENRQILTQRYRIYSMEPWVPKERKEQLNLYRIIIETKDKDIDDPDFIILKQYYEDLISYRPDNIIAVSVYEKVNSTNHYIARRILANIINQVQLEDDEMVETIPHKFMRKCPAVECRGYLSTRWKCEICNKYTCNKCYIIHVGDCKQEDIASFELIKQETRPCPKCSAIIFKISGCDQMWCTQCHTAFSWNTGKIETHIHNPHYFEYMASRNDRTVNERCDMFEPPEKFTNHYAVAHALLDKYRIKGNGTLDLRYKFLCGEFDEYIFKREIQKRLKENDKKREFIDICNMFITILTDRLTLYITNEDLHSIIIDDIEELRKTYNILIQRVGESYGSVGFELIVIKEGLWENISKNKAVDFKEFDYSII